MTFKNCFHNRKFGEMGQNVSNCVFGTSCRGFCFLVLFYRNLVFVCRHLVYLPICLFLPLFSFCREFYVVAVFQGQATKCMNFSAIKFYKLILSVEI